jgi:nucleoside-diphosphate-sugar epimerase
LRGFAALTWRLRLQPTPPGWVDMAFSVPLLDSRRAHEELGWRPRFSGTDALRDVLEGIREGAGIETPPLAPRAVG